MCIFYLQLGFNKNALPVIAKIWNSACFWKRDFANSFATIVQTFHCSKYCREKLLTLFIFMKIFQKAIKFFAKQLILHLLLSYTYFGENSRKNKYFRKNIFKNLAKSNIFDKICLNLIIVTCQHCQFSYILTQNLRENLKMIGAKTRKSTFSL